MKVDHLRGELERVKLENLDTLSKQKDEFQVLEKKKNAYIDKLIEYTLLLDG